MLGRGAPSARRATRGDVSTGRVRRPTLPALLALVLALGAAPARARGLGALRRDAAAMLGSVETGTDGRWSDEGERWSCYGLYALEKACLRGHREDRGRRPVRGPRPRPALDAGKDGGLSTGSMRVDGQRIAARSDLLPIAFAPVYLRCAAEVDRPVTPSPGDRHEDGPVTPAPAAPTDPRPPPPAPATPPPPPNDPPS